MSRRLAFLAVLAIALSLPAGASARSLRWSGERWHVKESAGSEVGPGPNVFSAGRGHVWLDDRDRLHLRIAERDGSWACAEVWTRAHHGYGTYTFRVNGSPSALDPNAVLGLFTWDDHPGGHHRELDVEWSRWGDPADPTEAQFVVQPYFHDGNLHRVDVPDALTRSTWTIRWLPNRVAFRAARSPGGARIAHWTYRGPDVPVPGDARIHLNLCLFQGMDPSDGEPVEIVVRGVSFDRR